MRIEIISWATRLTSSNGFKGQTQKMRIEMCRKGKYMPSFRQSFKGQTQKMRIEICIGPHTGQTRSCFKGQTQKMRIEIPQYFPFWKNFITGFKGQTQKMRIEMLRCSTRRRSYRRVSKVKLRKWGLKYPHIPKPQIDNLSFKGQTQKMRIEIMPVILHRVLSIQSFKGQTQKMRIEI